MRTSPSRARTRPICPLLQGARRMGDSTGSVRNSGRIAPREIILTLRSFPRGGGTLLDLEFLQDDKGRSIGP